MKIIVKKPGVKPEICEVNNICDINKLVGNVDEKGNGINDVSTDIRGPIGLGIDQYTNEKAAFNSNLEENLWSKSNNSLFCGTIVFAGYDKNNTTNFGACSLTDEQIKYCLTYISKQEVKHNEEI